MHACSPQDTMRNAARSTAFDAAESWVTMSLQSRPCLDHGQHAVELAAGATEPRGDGTAGLGVHLHGELLDERGHRLGGGHVGTT